MTEDERLIIIGMIISFHRMGNGWSLVDFAAETELNRLHIARIENGTANFEFKTISRICEELEIKLSDLFDDEHLQSADL